MNYIILYLFIFSSIALGACDVYFKLDSVPKKINRTEFIEFNHEVTKTTDAHQFIDDSNLDDLFSHNYSDDLKGAKAVYHKGADGDDIVVFWKTGDKSVGNNIHHRDAFHTILEKDADNLYKKGLEDKWFKADEAKTEFIEIGRSSDSFTKEMLEKSQGFQFTIKEGKIIHFDVDSSITSAQITRGIKISPEDFASSIEETIKRIDLDVLNIKSIRVNNFENVLKVIGQTEEEFQKILNLKLKGYLKDEIKVEGMSRNTKYLNN